MIGRGVAEGIDNSQQTVHDSVERLAQGISLEGHAFTLPTPMLGEKQYLHASPHEGSIGMSDVVEAIRTLQAALPNILSNAIPDDLSERDLGRLVRRYA